MYYHDTLKTPIGEIGLIKQDGILCMITLFEEDMQSWLLTHPSSQQSNMFVVEKQQLQEYFAGERKQFDFPLSFGGTVFQRQVWQALQDIPYGETRSYKDIACSISNPKAVRGVGQANKANPLPIVIPCHRVISSANTLIGFAGNHTDIQQQLLELEQVYIEQKPSRKNQLEKSATHESTIIHS